MNKKLLQEVYNCKYCDSIKLHSKDCFKRSLGVKVTTKPARDIKKNLIEL